MPSPHTALVRKPLHARLVLDVMEHQGAQDELARDVALGLAARPKALPPKYFYDAQGSRLFEQITALEAYYPTRIETGILAAHGADILAAAGEPRTLVELGSGSSTKTRLLLDVLSRQGGRVDYVPIDVSPTVVTEFGQALLRDYPTLHIRGLICDYHRAMGVLRDSRETPRLFLFLGSSLGNYTPSQSAELLAEVAEAMGPTDGLLLGVDLKKDPAVLRRAYNDPEGITAAFNLNLLHRINRELGGHFAVERFDHVAFYDEQQGRIEMHLESTLSQQVVIDALGKSFLFDKGETLHTENSYKFDSQGLAAILEQAGLRLSHRWLDDAGWFALNLVQPR